MRLDPLIELMVVSKFCRDDDVRNGAKIDALIEILLEKENISKAPFENKYKENVVKTHLFFKKRYLSDKTICDSEEEREKIMNQTITKMFEQLSEEDKENIMKIYL